MKRLKRIAAALLGALTAILLLPAQALAAGSIDLSRGVSLTVSYADGKTALSGAQFDMYLIATVDENGELTATGAFSSFPVDIRGRDDDAWNEVASTLEGYILRDKIAPTDSAKTNAQGLASFPNAQARLTAGLYLVRGQQHRQSGTIYEAATFLVMLPGLDRAANAWLYDVTVSAKFTSRPVPTAIPDASTRKVLKVWKDSGHETSRPKEVVVQLIRDSVVVDTVTLNAANNWRYTWKNLPSGHKWTVVEKELEGYTVTVKQEGITFVVTNTYGEADLPEDTPPKPPLIQTGQLWWPVPALLAGGLLLIVFGLIRRKNHGNEA